MGDLGPGQLRPPALGLACTHSMEARLSDGERLELEVCQRKLLDQIMESAVLVIQIWNKLSSSVNYNGLQKFLLLVKLAC